MNVEEVLEAVEQGLLLRQLSPVERFILRQSWMGHTYSDIARDSSYCSAHIKEIGSRLWHDLSEALGERVTKKNLHLVWNQFQENYTGNEQSTTPKDLRTDTVAKDDFSPLFTHTQIKFPGSPLPLNSPLYINRPPIEELACAEISQPGCVIRIKAPKRMGKSSLLNRMIAHAKDLGYKAVSLDFQEADTAIFSSIDKFLRWFCINISKQLNLDSKLDDYWDEDMGSKVSCKIYFQDYLLELIDSPLVLALNEVNRVFEHPSIAQDFLPMLRLWHEQARTLDIWQKLRLVVVHSTEIYVPLKLNQSPFNVGLALQVPQFSLEQVQNLAQRYGINWADTSAIAQLMAMVGGHPYLLNVALYHLSRQDMTLEHLLETAPMLTGIYGHHLRGHLEILRQDSQLVSSLQEVISALDSVELEAIAAYKLESMGLVQLDGNHAKLSCELYRRYFRKQLYQEDELSVSSVAIFNR
ncbi:AAA-like domain-containing protein [Argonema antarcticum]|uniref:AAA-like domain-containing protein n=1 Tax=Argonema antarcticum TaxID=2942763 RepID=UPI002012545B|nr:AAA-like domain-containing protein [Argonema antarcticum]MCL1475679.1 AAA-like domain-containing protein [Argonema antarcticum A004/B2]